MPQPMLDGIQGVIRARLADRARVDMVAQGPGGTVPDRRTVRGSIRYYEVL